MYGHCNTLKCLKVRVFLKETTLKCIKVKYSTVKRLKVKYNTEEHLKVKYSTEEYLKVKVTLKNSRLKVRSIILNDSIIVNKYLLNAPITVHYNVTCDISSPYLYLKCLDGIVYTKNNKPIFVLK